VAERLWRDPGIEDFDDQEVRLGWIHRHLHARYVRNGGVDLGLVAPLTPVDLGEPAITNAQAGDGGTLRDDVAAEIVRRRCRELFKDVGCGHDRADAQACEAQPLREAVDRDAALGIKTGGKRVRIGEVAIRAVVDEIRTDFARYLRERLDFGRRIADAERIVGVDEVNDARAFVDRVRELRRGESIPLRRVVDG
jgi:hypothetical protein